MLDVNGPAHIFYEAMQLGLDLDLHFISMGGEKEVQSSAGLYFAKLGEYAQLELGEQDYIFIPGTDPDFITNESSLESFSPFLKWMAVQALNKVNICSVCTGTFILAKAGLLDGRECTTHWRYIQLLSERYPSIKSVDNRLFVSSEHIYSSAGVSSGIDLALYILNKIGDGRLVSKVAKEVVYPIRRNEGDPQLNIYLQYRNHLDNRILTVQDYMIQHLADSFVIADLAALVNMSPRNLTRIFKKKTQITISNYLNQLRIEKASQWLRDGHKVETVARACGLKSSNQLRSLFKKYKDVLPSQVRQA